MKSSNGVLQFPDYKARTSRNSKEIKLVTEENSHGCKHCGLFATANTCACLE
jgi:hypothetical protein